MDPWYERRILIWLLRSQRAPPPNMKLTTTIVQTDQSSGRGMEVVQSLWWDRSGMAQALAIRGFRWGDQWGVRAEELC